MLKFYRIMQYTKSFNTIVCTPDLVIIKYIRNNTIEIERIVFTYPHLPPSALVVEFQLNSESGWWQIRLINTRSCNYSCTSS